MICRPRVSLLHLFVATGVIALFMIANGTARKRETRAVAVLFFGSGERDMDVIERTYGWPLTFKYSTTMSPSFTEGGLAQAAASERVDWVSFAWDVAFAFTMLLLSLFFVSRLSDKS